MDRHVACFAALFAALASACTLDAAGTASNEPFGDGGAIDVDPFDASVDTTTPVDSFVPDTFVPDTVVPDTLEPDTAEPDTSAPDTSAPDTSPDADGSTCNDAACHEPPLGAKRVALVDRTVACPPGFITTDVLEPRAGSGCACDCTLAANPTCPAAGPIATKYGTDATCAETGATLSSSGACTVLGSSYSLAARFSATGPAAVGGACTPSPTTNKDAVTQPLRLCEAGPTACAGDACTAPFTECIEYAGACPATFPNRRTVGTDVTITCPACTCGVTATCHGKITLFGNSGCDGGGSTFPVNGSCVDVPVSTGTMASFLYEPNPPTGVGCSRSFVTAAGTPQVIGQRNLCCR